MEAFTAANHGAQKNHHFSTPKKTRRKRTFTPEEKKDVQYWEKRHRNNEAAKRSREKRKAKDQLLDRHLKALRDENTQLTAELLAMKAHFGLVLPVAYSNPLTHHVYSSNLPIPPFSHLQPFHKNYYKRGPDQAGVTTHPLFIPAAAHWKFSNPHGSPSSGFFNSPSLPKNWLPLHSSNQGASFVNSIFTSHKPNQEEKPMSRIMFLS